MRLLFVGDGEREAQTIPFLVERILDTPVEAEARNWARLHSSAGRGYDRKLLFSLRQARDLCVRGLVATVDRDTDKPFRRLNELKKGLTQDRKNNSEIPTALGEAVPHGEAWLLDDAAAVREVLGLSASVKISSVGKVDPKSTLDDLISDSAFSSDHMTALRDIARAVDISRCPNAKKTGLDTFAEEVRTALGSLAADRHTS